MIVVTGSARTGTSLMMYILSELGVPLVAPKFLYEHRNIKRFNNNGFYDTDPQGLRNTLQNNYDNVCAVKLFGASLGDLNSDFISHFFVCTRECNEINESLVKISTDLYGRKITLSEANDICDANYQLIKRYVKDNDVFVRVVDYNNVMRDPRYYVTSVAQAMSDYIEIPCINKRIEKICNNIATHQSGGR